MAIRFRQIPTRLRQFFERQVQHSFEVMFAFFCIYLGVVSLFQFGVAGNAINNALGLVASILFNVVFATAGLLIYFGIGFGRGNLEAAGLILLAMSLFVRSVAAGWLLGLSPLIVNTYVLNGVLVFSCAVRFALLLKAQRALRENGL